MKENNTKHEETTPNLDRNYTLRNIGKIYLL